jgi:hypothetical protein
LSDISYSVVSIFNLVKWLLVRMLQKKRAEDQRTSSQKIIFKYY